MRKWEQSIRRDSEAWDDFKHWLTELADSELRRLMHLDMEKVERQRGLIEGIHHVLFHATATEREELASARRPD